MNALFRLNRSKYIKRCETNSLAVNISDYRQSLNILIGAIVMGLKPAAAFAGLKNNTFITQAEPDPIAPTLPTVAPEGEPVAPTLPGQPESPMAPAPAPTSPQAVLI